MSAISNYAENLLLDWLFNGTAPTRPTAWHLALHTANPTDAGTGSEVSGGSYARQALTLAAATGGSRANSGTITFSGLPAVTVTHFGIWDAPTGGNLLWYGALNAQQVVAAGNSLIWNAGSLTVSLD